MNILSQRYLPLTVYTSYTFFILMSLFLGPITYEGMNIIVLTSFITVHFTLFFLGYVVGARGRFREVWSCSDARSNSYQRIGKFLGLLIVLGVISSLLQWLQFMFSDNNLNIGGIGQSYVEGYDGYERGKARIDLFYIVDILGQALITLVLLFSFYYFRVLSPAGKLACIFVVTTYLVVNVIGTGKQKYLGDVVVYAFFSALLGRVIIGKKFKIKTIVLVVALSCIVLFLFLEIFRQRYVAAGINIENIVEKAHPLVSWNVDSPLFNLVGPEYALAVGVFLGYFTNGLYGLYLSLTLPFEWTYFVGNSYSLGRVFEIIFSSPGYILEKTYPYRVGVTYGWGFDKWHSLFAWLASDLTFPGVLVLSSLFAFVYARLWIQAVRSSNPFSGPLFLYLSLGLIFSYSNNQLMHGLSGVIVLAVLSVGWLGSSNRVTYPKIPITVHSHNDNS
tara:strand:+ start:4732 stop:6072 length:1341 start_codon:yes stop_codon:yes gene_type:complete